MTAPIWLACLAWLAWMAVEALTASPAAMDGSASIPSVVAVAETEPVSGPKDAADDPAVYVHPIEPALSAVIGTDKQGTLVVYDLDGAIRQELPIGRVNSVDLRDGFPVDGRSRTLVAASNRTDDRIWLFLVDEADGTLVEVNGEPIPTGVFEIYGLCLHRQPASGDTFVIITSNETGEVEQYRLTTGPEGITGELVRRLDIGSQSEGCVADDALGWLYIAEEDVGIWRYRSDPEAGDERILIDGIQPEGHLVADIEGLTLAIGEGEGGFLIASVQSESLFAVYERGGANRFLGRFRVVTSDEGIDGVSATDGIDVSLARLPPPFEEGLLVVQDGVNEPAGSNQDFKLIRWVDVVRAMGLTPVRAAASPG